MDGIASLAPELQQAFHRASQAERRPLATMESRKTNAEERLKLMTDVLGKVESARGALRPLVSATAIRELAVQSSDDKAVSGTADKNLAMPGKHSLEIGRLAAPPSAVSNGFPDPDQTRVGTGYIVFERSNGDAEEVYIDNDHATLHGVANSISAAGLGVKATVINDQSDPELPYRLMITGNASGETNNISYPEFYFVDGEQELEIEIERSAVNALIRYQGYEFETATNEVNDIVPGLALSLKGTTEPGRPAYVTVEQDVKKTSLKVKEMIDKLNDVFSFIQQQNKLDENSQTQKTLGGDYGIRLAESRLRNTLTQTYFDAKDFRSLGELGIEFQKDGLLKLEEKKLETAIAGKYEDVVNFICGDGVTTGLVTRLNQTLMSIAGGPNAILQLQKNNQTEAVRKMSKEIKEKESRIQDKEEILKQRLAKANAALEAIKAQSGMFPAEGASPR